MANGMDFSKQAFLDAAPDVQAALLYDVLLRIRQEVSPKRTFLIAMIGGAGAVVFTRIPGLLSAVFKAVAVLAG